MATDTVLNELILQEVTQAEYEQLGKDNLLDETRIYLTPDSSLKGTLLDFKWADHLLNDMSWLRADTFSWHSGDVYVAAYNHLVADFEGTTAETETVGNTEITFYRAEDGHKICLADQEDALLELYNKTGVAWYYILDTVNKQFKLPRSKHNKYADTVPVVGNGMALGITNGQTSRAIGATTVHDSQTTTALMLSNNEPKNMAVGTSVSVTNTGGNDLGTGKAYGVSTTPDSSGLIAQQEQDADQYKYLYFYVGCFDKEGLEQTAGITAETFNSKADTDLSNMNASQAAKDTIVGWSMPDYDAGVQYAYTDENTAPSNGYFVVRASAFNNTQAEVTLNGVVFRLQTSNNNTYSTQGTTWIPVSKGDVIKGTAGYVSGTSSLCTITFYPCKGVL